MKTSLSRILVLFLMVMGIILAGDRSANALYSYDVQFGELIVPNVSTYPADGFSFTSPQLIGPEFPGSPYIDSVMFVTPLELNGLSFDGFRNAGFSWSGSFSPENLLGLAFQPLPGVLTLPLPPAGNVADFYITISFPQGTYGPGVYTNADGFGRGISAGGGLVSYFYTNGTLTITETTAPVPEPCTMLLVSSGLVGVAGLRKRFKR